MSDSMIMKLLETVLSYVYLKSMNLETEIPMSDSLDNLSTSKQHSTAIDKQKSPHTKKKLKKLQAQVCPTLRCAICPEKRFGTLTEYDEHFASKRHLRRKVNYTADVKGSADPSPDTVQHRSWRCLTCKRTFQYYHDWFKHLTAPLHLQILQDEAKKLTQNRRPAYTLHEVRKVEQLVREQSIPEEE
ncbi:hypothetical protein K493DRAFT_337052 [Basidiobolus meristosporus CBS 931.73]|uniref:C2H2-type domain-containing protein n=1 Tax=Basidiobolus meristosporus CBS 931.73 TaxID=1314790 RepID=A0A1Y1YDQ2_9FUNG|nr:hypothetical protein K493DRAFT_337052 [Basidiobolus meristosporus CBS 931.73]|eukprot:ORX96150.1 hypothetical protein K493DRAFT_337052 [Basidiobolus meristosporus CBS 931.73]